MAKPNPPLYITKDEYLGHLLLENCRKGETSLIYEKDYIIEVKVTFIPKKKEEHIHKPTQEELEDIFRKED